MGRKLFRVRKHLSRCNANIGILGFVLPHCNIKQPIEMYDWY